MLSRDQRLSRKEFTPVFKLGKRLNTSLFSVIYTKSETSKSKFGVVVSKKITKSAVERHKIRRWVYESVRAFLKNKTNYGFSVIFVAQPQIMKYKFKDIEDLVYKILNELN